MNEQTQPIMDMAQNRAHLTVAASYTDPVTKGVYLHRDLIEVQEPWAQEEHIGPTQRSEPFGDVESWVSYVQRYADANCLLLTWSARGLTAVLDYINATGNAPGRCQWLATHLFKPTRQWQAWISLANGQARPQKHTVEMLENLAEDVVPGEQGDLLNLLRSLRTSVNAKAEAELRPDGSTSVSFQRETQVKASGAVEVPSMIGIAIPVLQGHLDDEGKPVYYHIGVRLRVDVDDNARLLLRLSMPTADRVMEDACRDRSVKAATLLGGDYTLLRATD